MPSPARKRWDPEAWRMYPRNPSLFVAFRFGKPIPRQS